MVVPHDAQVPRSRVDGCALDALDSVVAMKTSLRGPGLGRCELRGAISFINTHIVHYLFNYVKLVYNKR